MQLQIWTVILSWLLLGESLSAAQIAASVTVMIGAMLCVFFQKSGRPNKNHVKEIN